ncbi:hypothetical protein PTMSG1_03034 [Pyrenophora teres f. maculata]|nr:hypothetical protein PTMSG1_03034 [Pyrenophora teres f. maculata]
MPPLPTSSSQASGRSWLTNSSEHRYLLEGIILWSLFVTACRSIVVLVARRKSRMSRSSPNRSDLPSDQDEKKPTPHQRKDSYQDDLSNPPPFKQEDTETTTTWPPIKQEQPQNTLTTNLPFPIHPNTYLDSIRQETLQPAFIPIYPWISAPKALPGPYDAPYYPLPLPTLQPETGLQDTTEIQDPAIKNEEVNREEEALEAALYTRHIPLHSAQDSEAVLRGAVIVSGKGWRRTQWTVMAG